MLCEKGQKRAENGSGHERAEDELDRACVGPALEIGGGRGRVIEVLSHQDPDLRPANIRSRVASTSSTVIGLHSAISNTDGPQDRSTD